MSIQWGDSTVTDLLRREFYSVVFSKTLRFELIKCPPTFFLHAGSEALLQPAVSALISLVFVYDALSVKPEK